MDVITPETRLCVRLRAELKPENILHHGNYPNTYGQLNFVLAFATGGTVVRGCHQQQDEKPEFQPTRPWKWLVWRALVFAYLTAVFFFRAITDWDDGEWFYYLTHWQSTIFMLYGTSALATCVALRLNYANVLHATSFEESNANLRLAQPNGYHMPWYVRLTWVLHGLAMSCGVWVLIMFWSMVYTTEVGQDEQYVRLALIDHFSTIFLVLIDFYLAAFPWLLFQFAWSQLFISVYVCWTGIHYALGLTNRMDYERYVYERIDWSLPVETFFIVLVLIFLALPLVNLLLWFAFNEGAYGRFTPRRLVPWMRNNEQTLANKIEVLG